MKKELEKIGTANETSKAIMAFLMSRQRFRDTSNIVTYKVKLIQAGYKINPVDYSNFWKQLEAQGFGKLSGKIFNWSFNFRNLDKPKVAINARKDVPAPSRLIFIPLMNGKDFQISLPEGTTDTDINNITRILTKVKNRELP